MISGGQPEIEGSEGCRFEKDTDFGAGLWIFQRAQERDDALVNKGLDLLKSKGFDTSVLNSVDQTMCDGYKGYEF